MSRRRSPPRRPVATPADLDASLRRHELLQTHMARLRPECIREVPPCGAGLSLSSWRALLVAMSDRLTALGALARYAGDHFRGALPDGRGCELALAEVAARCVGVAEDEIPAQVEAHLRAVLGSVDAPPTDDDDLRYERVAPRLIAQIYRDDSLGPAREHIVTRPLCEGLVSALAVDLGFGISTLPRSLIASWERPEDALFRAARENLRRRPARKIPVPGDALGGFLLQAEDIALCAQVQLLSAHLHAPPRAGALVAMPSRHTLLCLPLRPGGPEEVTERVALALDLTEALYTDFATLTGGEGIFSPDLYFWEHGRLHAIPALRLGEAAVAMPPDAFFDAVTRPTSAGDLH